MNNEAKEFIHQLIPRGITIFSVTGGDFSTFFSMIRHLPIKAINIKAARKELGQIQKIIEKAPTMLVITTFQAQKKDIK